MALEKATLTNTVTGERVPVLFNPEEYSIARENNFAQVAVPGLRSPLLQFVHGNLQTVEMELLVDTVEAHEAAGKRINAAGEDVRNLTRKVTSLLDIDPTTHAPPVVVFTWGSLSFTCVVARVQQRFILFRADGTPLRARLTVRLDEFTNAEMEAKETKRETADYSKRYEVIAGDTLSTIASRVYGDPTLWRPIALHNGVRDPRRLVPGSRLLIPALPYRDPVTLRVYGPR